MRKADTLFSMFIRQRGICAASNYLFGNRRHECSGPLQAAHGFSRRYKAVRYDQRQVFCLCRNAHHYMTLHPLEWDAFMRYEMGEDYEKVRQIALQGRAPDYAAVVAQYS